MVAAGLDGRGTLLLDDDHVSLKRAAAIIKAGGLVAFPTETVYGLGAAATNDEAIKKIFHAKGRPQDNPLIVHIASRDQLTLVTNQLPAEAGPLMDHFWPGPLSLVLPRAASIPPLVSAGLNTVAVRMPDHPVALDLIRLAGLPLAAPSANRSGRPSPTSFKHVLQDLAGRIDAVIRSKACVLGVESTVLDLTGSRPVILRPGGVTREALETALGRSVPLVGQRYRGAPPPSPGMKYRHYSPRAPLLLVTGPEERRKGFIAAYCAHCRRQGLKVAYLNRYISGPGLQSCAADRIAALLYRALRAIDTADVDLILAEEIDTAGIGLAVMNRLRKAALRTIKV